MFEFEEKSFSIIKTLICSILLLLFTVIFFLFVGICKVDAESISADTGIFSITYGGSSNIPSSWNSVTSGNTIQKEFWVYNWMGYTYPYTYVVVEFCTGTVSMIENANMYNTNYNNNWINDGVGVTYVTNDACVYGSYSGTVVRKQWQIGKYADADGTGEELSAGAYLRVTNDKSWWSFYRINNVYLSSTDELSALAEGQTNTKDIINKIEDAANDVIQSQKEVQAAIIANTNANTDKVVDAIEGDGLTNDTPVDKTTENEYKEAEDALLNEENLNLMDDIEISLDSNSNDFIWSMVTSIVNSHSLIFGFIITILSLGVLKLVLNR